MKLNALRATFGLALTVVTSVASVSQAQEVSSFNACVSDPPQSAGLYRFNVGEYAPEQLIRNVYASGGGIADDNYYYSVHYEVIGGIPVIECTSYSLRNWAVEDRFTNCKITNVATDLAYFAPRDEAYGCYFNESGNGYVFGKSKLSNFGYEKIADLEVAFAALDFDAQGTLYAIDWMGRLMIIDPATGAQTLVGDTGKTTSMITGGAIDRATGVFIFSVKNNDESALYTIDLATAAATKLYDLENDEQLGGLYFPQTYATGAPAASGNPTVSFSGTAMNGTVRFRAPQKSVGGDLLTDPVTYHIEANGVEVATGTATYSDGYQSVPVEIAQPGRQCFSLYFSNESGRGPRSKAVQYVGADTPRAPLSPRMTYKDGTVKLFWTAGGSTGVNGGNIDRTGMYYKIVRYPDGEVYSAENSGWTQQIEMPAERTTYYYEITTVAGGLESVPAQTPTFDLGPIVPPLSESFATLYSTFGWNWINNDSYIEDNYSTGNGMRLVTMGAPEEGTYLVTPPMNLVAGATYDLSVSLKRGNTRYSEQFSVVAGSEATPVGLSEMTLIEDTPLDADDFTEFTTSFIPVTTGTYYIALHGTSPDGRMMYLKNFEISKGVVKGAPGEVTALTAEADQTGVKKATIRFTAPSVTFEGDPLTQIDYAEISRDNEPIITVSDGVAPGAEIEVVDDAVKTVGYHTYTVACYNAAGNGSPVSTRVWVGFNEPEPVEWIKVKETETLGTVEVTWAPAVMDIDGKPFGDATVTYNLYDIDYELVKSGLTETSMVIRATEPAARQSWAQYRVVAVSEGGSSEMTKSMLTPVGRPDVAPWRESWAGKETSHIIGMTQNSVGDTWMIVGGFSYKDRDIDPQDNDGGMLGLENTSPDETISFFTGKIDLSHVVAPALTYYVYNYIGDNGKANANEIAVKILGDNDEDFVPLSNVVIGETGPAKQWNKVTVPLTGYDNQTVRLRLEATINTAIYVHLDNMSVNTSSPCNIGATAIKAPVSVNPDEEFEVAFTVDNNGDAAIPMYMIELFADNESIEQFTLVGLSAGTSRNVTLKQTLTTLSPDRVTYKYKVSAEGDLIESDNYTDEAVVLLRRNGNPAVTTLAASSTSSAITLDWETPDMSTAAPDAVTENFETAPAWKSEVSGWSFIDLDRATIGGIGKKQLPVSGQQSFFVIDDTYSALNDANSGDRFKAHSGKQALWSMYSMRGKTYVQSDDWAITPLLYGGPQTASLWASSFKSDAGQPQYYETFEVLASQTGTEPEDFTLIDRIENVSAAWTRYEFYLPAGTRYMAIHGISYDKYLLMIDDVEFVPDGGAPRQLNLTGYNLYRDGVKLNDTPLATTNYVDNNAVSGQTHHYRVTALYGDAGESEGSNEVAAALTSALGALAGDGAVSVKAQGCMIVVKGCQSGRVAVYDAAGRNIAATDADGNVINIPVTAGVYMVTAAGNTYKVIAR